MNDDKPIVKTLIDKDIQAIESILGRNPNPSELELLAWFNRKRLVHRPYYEALDRMDAVAKSAITNQCELDENLTLYIKSHSLTSSIKDNNDSELWRSKADILFEELIINETHAHRRNKKLKHSQIHWTLKESHNPGHGLYSIYSTEPISYSHPQEEDHWLVIPIKSFKQTKDIPSDINTLIFEENCLDGLIQFMLESQMGIRILEPGLTPLFDYSGPGLFVWWTEGAGTVASRLTRAGLPAPLASGTFQTHPEIHCETPSIQLPREAFDFTKKSFTHGASITFPALSSDWSFQDLKTSLDWNQTLIQVLRAVRSREPELHTVQAERHQKVGIVPLPDTSRWISAVPDNDYFLPVDPKTGGQLMLANAVRRLTCLGIKAQFVQLNLWLPDPERDELWKGLHLLEAMDSTTQRLGLSILSRDLNPMDKGIDLQCSVHAQIKATQSLMDPGFKDDGDFISLLGSHRGELGGSIFLREIYDKTGGPIPVVDMAMETRIQEVVLQGIESGLIKSAISVGPGGLSVAAVQALLSSPEGLGARIHLSRKLRDDELMFGETQGLVMITLGENDIMEFERICMNIGVTSTTIGRVTTTGRFTFNQLINLPVDQLRSC